MTVRLRLTLWYTALLTVFVATFAVLVYVAVDRQLASAPEKPSVLPVLFKPGKSDLVAAERQYPLVLKIPATSTDHLEGIERLMKSRSRSTSGI